LSAAKLAEWVHYRGALRAFAERFFPHLCTVPFARMHDERFAHEKAMRLVRGRREAIAAPRGNAKTTLRGFIQIVHDCVYRTESFILIISNTVRLAEDRVKHIRDELGHNQELVRFYGVQHGPAWNQGMFITKRAVPAHRAR